MRLPSASQYPNVSASERCPLCGNEKVAGYLLCYLCDEGFRQVGGSNRNVVEVLRRAEQHYCSLDGVTPFCDINPMGRCVLHGIHPTRKKTQRYL